MTEHCEEYQLLTASAIIRSRVSPCSATADAPRRIIFASAIDFHYQTRLRKRGQVDAPHLGSTERHASFLKVLERFTSCHALGIDSRARRTSAQPSANPSWANPPGPDPPAPDLPGHSAVRCPDAGLRRPPVRHAGPHPGSRGRRPDPAQGRRRPRRRQPVHQAGGTVLDARGPATHPRPRPGRNPPVRPQRPAGPGDAATDAPRRRAVRDRVARTGVRR